MSSRDLLGTFELETAVKLPSSPRIRDLSHVSVEQCSGGDRHSIIDYFIDDTRLEDEFFGRRTLSLGDFDGTREIASPTRRRQEYVEDPACNVVETLLTPANANDFQTIRGHECDYASTPHQPKYVADNGTETWFEDEESFRDDQSYMLPGQLEALIESRCALDSGLQIQSAGPLETPLITPDDITERALVPSIRGEISNASTPELPYNGNGEENFEWAAPGFDASPASLHFFSQAGVHVTTRELQDDFVAAQVSKLAGGCLDIDQTSQIEKDRVTSEFFSLLLSKTTSSCLEATSPTSTVRIHRTKQKHATSAGHQLLLPAVYDGLADEDYYLGQDAEIPDFDHYPHISGQSTPNLEGDMLPAPLQFPLRGLRGGQHVTVAETVCDSPNTASTIQGVALNQLFLPDCNHLNTQQTTKARYNDLVLRIAEVPFRKSTLIQCRIDKAKIVRKRKAHDHESTYSSKRARLTFLNRCSSQIRAHASYLSEARSIKSTRDTSPSSSKSSLVSHILTSPMPQALKGFTGQFMLHVPDQIFAAQAPTRHYFGDRTHPNGLILNTSFTPDTRHSRKDLTEFDINHDNTFVLLIKHCEAKSILASSISMHAKRSAAENALRREAHRECASARLEGVPVGYYRYYVGHMTAEEYVEAGLCVCWDGCFCNTFCTRFGDLRCPCTERLVVVGEL